MFALVAAIVAANSCLNNGFIPQGQPLQLLEMPRKARRIDSVPFPRPTPSSGLLSAYTWLAPRCRYIL
jgi:hypothetical protein